MMDRTSLLALCASNIYKSGEMSFNEAITDAQTLIALAEAEYAFKPAPSFADQEHAGDEHASS